MNIGTNTNCTTIGTFTLPPARYACTVKSEKKEPRNLKEALESDDKEEWRKAILEELNALKTNDTWDLVESPNRRRPIHHIMRALQHSA